MVYIYNPCNGPIHHGVDFRIAARSYALVDEATAQWLRDTNVDILVEGAPNFPHPFLRYNASDIIANVRS